MKDKYDENQFGRVFIYLIYELHQIIIEIKKKKYYTYYVW